MMDLKNGVIEIFSQKIYLGMPYAEVIRVLEEKIKSDSMSRNQKDYGYVFTKNIAVFNLKAAECRLFFSDFKLEDVCFVVSPTFDEYLENVAKEKLTRDYFYEQINGLFEECVKYINAHFKPTKVINVRFKRFDYIFDKNVMSVAMDRDNETFSITIGEYHE